MTPSTPPSPTTTPPEPPAHTPRPRLAGWLLWGGWWLFLGVWTAALLTTAPGEASAEVLPPGPDYIVNNAAHVAVYALLTGALVFLPGRRKWWMLAFLSLHAAGTEVGQLYVPDRTGDPLDVFLNHLGIALGLAFAWWMARRGKD